MAVKIRLRRMGGRQKPYYRIVAADSRFPRNGRFIEILGTYNPLIKPAEIKLEDEKILTWLGKGAKPTDTVRSLLVNKGIMKKFAENVKKAK
jgi:small subunit ribosomal protein S16